MNAMSDLEKDIEASRARLDQTIDRIQDRLSAGSLVDEMLGSARGTPLNGLYDGALHAVRRNPVPVLLIAAGIGMLFSRISAAQRTPASARAIVPEKRASALRNAASRTDDVDPAIGALRGAHEKVRS